MPAKWWDTREVVAERREFFGSDFVSSREDAEREARRIIDARIGHLDAQEILQLGRVFNRHGKAGRIRYDRFSPGFAGAVMAKLAQNTVRFNEVVSNLWRGNVDDAVYLLGQMYADRTILPGAGSSLPSYLLYLRDPESLRGVHERHNDRPRRRGRRAVPSQQPGQLRAVLRRVARVAAEVQRGRRRRTRS